MDEMNVVTAPDGRRYVTVVDLHQVRHTLVYHQAGARSGQLDFYIGEVGPRDFSEGRPVEFGVGVHVHSRGVAGCCDMAGVVTDDDLLGRIRSALRVQ